MTFSRGFFSFSPPPFLHNPRTNPAPTSSSLLHIWKQQQHLLEPLKCGFLKLFFFLFPTVFPPLLPGVDERSDKHLPTLLSLHSTVSNSPPPPGPACSFLLPMPTHRDIVVRHFHPWRFFLLFLFFFLPPPRSKFTTSKESKRSCTASVPGGSSST